MCFMYVQQCILQYSYYLRKENYIHMHIHKELRLISFKKDYLDRLCRLIKLVKS
jgi:hypothetical protein